MSYEKMSASEGIEMQERGNNRETGEPSNPPAGGSPGTYRKNAGQPRDKTIFSSPALAVSSFLFAAAQNDVGMVQDLIEEEMVKVNDCDYDKRTALHVAAAEGHVEVIRLLLREGADVNVADRYHSTPLDDAIHHGYQAAARLLLEAGAKHGKGSNFAVDLVHAAGVGDLTTVQRLVETGIDINSSDFDGRTPLHVAIAQRQEEVVRYLLDNKADLHREDRFGGTPLEEAQRAGVRLGDDPILTLIQSHMGGKEHVSWRVSLSNPFFLTFLFIEIIIGILYAIFSYYGEGATPGADNASGIDTITQKIAFYMDVHVMIFIGFGFLMTFLRKYGYTAVGLTFIIGALAIQVYHLAGTFWQSIIPEDQDGAHWHNVYINITSLIQADFAAGAVLISFGALLGKVTFTQMLLLTVLEVFFYSLNEAISLKLQVADIGGSMVIHIFGAFFGLAASAVLTPKAAHGNKENSAIYHSDIFSMIGTIFLFMFWPSFNAALSEGNAQHRAVVNTVLSLTASVIFSFLFSQFWRRERRFSMVDIQNATLAGGVAMGSAADMAVHPAFALLIGAIAGTVSVMGFSLLQGAVENHLHIHDTCGVLNLHGMPGIIGAIAGIIASSNSAGSRYSQSQLLEIWHDRDDRDPSKQAKIQLAFLVITLAISIITGFLCGILLSKLSPPKKCFLDNESWETPAREVPYYFDVRGEARHSSEDPNSTAPQGAASASSVAKEGAQLDELQGKITYLENALRSQRKTLRDQARAIESLTGIPRSTLSGSTPATPGGAILSSPRGFGSLDPEESSSLLSSSVPLGRSVPSFPAYPQGNNPNNNNNINNLTSMIESLTAQVKFLVDQQQKK